MPKERICMICSNPHSFMKEIYRFQLNGLGFTVPMDGAMCPNCIEEIAANDLRHCDSIFRRRYDGLNIDWETFQRIQEENTESFSRLRTLLNLGILTFQKEGGWKIKDGMKIVNPHFFKAVLYFTRQADAQRYAQAMHSWTDGTLEIKQDR